MTNLTAINVQPHEIYFLSTGEFANQVRLSVSTVKRMCDKGQLASIVVSERGDRRIPRAEVERLLTEAESNRVAV
jgi:excisionase family DNA binding protein